MSNTKIDSYLARSKKWKPELAELRLIVLQSGLKEELKWGVPCYTLDGNNIVLIHDFKNYCALLFFKGALIKDTKQILVQQTKNVQSARQMRFTNVDDILKAKRNIIAYIKEAVEIEKSGTKVPFKHTRDFEIPVEFKEMMKADPSLKKSFMALTPGRQRGYLLYFSAPKLFTTRISRIKKSVSAIKTGKGLRD